MERGKRNKCKVENLDTAVWLCVPSSLSTQKKQDWGHTHNYVSTLNATGGIISVTEKALLLF